jgi:hypothetical protein
MKMGNWLTLAQSAAGGSQPPIVAISECWQNAAIVKRWFVQALPENGDVPKSPFSTLAALLPSAGTE